MCGGEGHGHDHGLPNETPAAVAGAAAAHADEEPFPWQSGRVYDAHCHPTDTMASLAGIPAMGAAALTVMSTRSQDQDLVAALGEQQGLVFSSHGDARAKEEGGTTSSRRKVVPAFGWHPWFSYQLYNDGESSRNGEGDGGGGELTSLEDKRRHLAAVLTPSPSGKEGNEDKDAALSEALDALAVSLPAIRPLSAFLAETRTRLLAHPTALVGEIGIDKAFRVPEPPPAATKAEGAAEQGSQQDQLDAAAVAPSITPGGREGRRLSPFRVQPAHQVAVLAAQLRLAAELRRPVSVHGVQAHGQLFAALAATWKGQERTDVLSRRQRRQIAEGAEDFDDEDEDEKVDDDERAKTRLRYPPAICLHSFSGPADMLRQYLDPHIPAAIYFSFSTAVNCSTPAGCQRTAEVVAACPDNRLLVESDLHTAGPDMDAALEAIYRRVCAIKHWSLTEGVERIAQNYDAFILRTKRPKAKPKQHTKHLARGQ